MGAVETRVRAYDADGTLWPREKPTTIIGAIKDRFFRWSLTLTLDDINGIDHELAVASISSWRDRIAAFFH